jgi:UDP-glucose 4-epimerase
MKVLLTGATGFLGKRLLELLIRDERVKSIEVVSRKKRTHPDPKVRVIHGDLAEAASRNTLPADPDAVVHLAGFYNFKDGFAVNYKENVLTALTLLDWLKQRNRKKPVPIYYSSTYVVTHGGTREATERPVEALPGAELPYAYTKALAEKTFSDADLPGAIFRLGVLVGDTERGDIEKLDGPYPFLKLLRALGSFPLTKALKVVPIPADPKGVLPLVPVDSAAMVFHRAIFEKNDWRTGRDVFGVYNTESLPLGALAEAILGEFLPGARPTFVSSLPPLVLRLQSGITGVTPTAFHFSMHPVSVHNPRFLEQFPDCRIPPFSEYREAFFAGFRQYIGA